MVVLLLGGWTAQLKTNVLVQMGSFSPKFWGENQTWLKPTPSLHIALFYENPGIV